MSDDAVRAKTGRSWDEWFQVLDAAGARDMEHLDIASWLHEKRELPGWWAQMVTVGYERARGRRELHQTAAGYQVSRSKTVNVPVSRLFAAWNDKRVRDRWIEKGRLVVRKATPPKSMRMVWEPDGTRVEANFYPKTSAKSQVTVQHRKLPGSAEAARMQSYWGEKLERLKSMLES